MVDITPSLFYPMICDSVLGEVIRAYLFTSLSGPDLLSAQIAPFSRFFLLFFLQKPSPEYRERKLFVFLLKTPLLGCDNQTAGNMRNSDS